VAVAVDVLVSVRVGVGPVVKVLVAVLLGVGVRVLVRVGDGPAVLVRVGVRVFTGVKVRVRVGDGPAVFVLVGVSVGAAVILIWRVIVQVVGQLGKANVNRIVKSPQMPSAGSLSKSFSQVCSSPPPSCTQVPP
jgi:hypothetical protein